MSTIAPARPARRQESFSRVAPMLGAALLIGASGGFVLATVLTLTRAFHVTTGAWWVALAQAHGHLQLYGWAGLFVLGVALHFLPRLRGAGLAFPQAIPWLLGTLVAGIVLRGLGQPLFAATGQGIWKIAMVASGALEMVVFLGFLTIVVATAMQGSKLSTRPQLQKTLPFLVGIFASLGLAAIINLVNVVGAGGAPVAGVVPASGDAINVTLGLLGFLVPMALTMSAQTLPMYAGLEPFPRKLFWPLAIGYFGGLALALVGIGSGISLLEGLGTFLVGAVLLIFVSLFIRLMRARGKLPQRVAKLAPEPEAAEHHYRRQISSDRSAYGPFVALVASAYTWAIVGGALLVIDGIAGVLDLGAPFSPDAARHSLAIGFIALLICGIAPRMVPGFSGGHILSAKLVTATLWLGNSAAILRVGSLLIAPLLDALGPAGAFVDALLFGLSGPLGLALAICLAVNLWPALFPKNSR
ncbi:MAG TPA: hypothetical protein VFU60_05155 [Ktedonobacterales bacterium]|nr:hypothetical protein [Ktedonobacterales bacterium]